MVDDARPPGVVEAERRAAAGLLWRQSAGLPELRRAAPRILVETGGALDGIVRAAAAQRADLVVLGAQRRRPLRDALIGTTAERVARHGGRPVLMVNRLPDGPYRRVLAAVDLAEGSARALRAGAALGLLEGADLTVLHAFRAPGRDGLVLACAPRDAIEDHHSATALATRADLARLLAGEGLGRMPPSRLLVEEGRPAAVIGRAVERLRPDLVLLGAGARGALGRILLGSVAEEVMTQLDCDVLAVPPPAGGGRGA
jgi:nucleotide-binding universal stress UspA family protein